MWCGIVCNEKVDVRLLDLHRSVSGFRGKEV
jgi:hypothetical protein